MVLDRGFWTVFNRYRQTTQSGLVMLVLLATGGLLACASPAFAQSPICAPNHSREPAASTQRTVMLPDFGLTVAIPSNYRVIKRTDGSVEILHPDDFAVIRCVAQGGRGTSGYYSERIRWVDPSPMQNLREQAIWSVGYSYDAQGNPQPAYSDIREYQERGFSGYIVRSSSEYGVTFLGTVPTSNRLLMVDAACDCPVETEAVTDLLSRLTLMNAAPEQPTIP